MKKIIIAVFLVFLVLVGIGIIRNYLNADVNKAYSLYLKCQSYKDTYEYQDCVDNFKRFSLTLSDGDLKKLDTKIKIYKGTCIKEEREQKEKMKKINEMI